MQIDFEGRLLGNIAMYDTFRVLKDYSITLDYFKLPNARMAYMAMKEIDDEGGNINLVLLAGKLRNLTPEWSNVTLYVQGYANDPTEIGDHTRQYAAILKEEHIRSEANITIEKLRSVTNANEKGRLLGELSDLLNNALERTESCSVKTIREIASEYTSVIDKRVENYRNGVKTGITTGLVELDDYTSGFQDNNLVILAGRPAMGKTAMALHFALAAANSGKRVVLFSLEMGNTQLYERLLSSVSEINLKNMRTGNVNEYDVSTYNQAVGVLMDLPLLIDEDPNKTTGDIRRVLTTLKKNGECDMAIIDYLQLLDVEKSTSRNTTREQMISRATRELKIIAKQVGIPIVVLCQLSRAVESRASKEPMLSDLRESGSIEQDADLVMFVYRPEYYDNAESGNNTNIGYLIIGKNREGKVGKVAFQHNQSLTQIRDANGTEY